jgi:hypothetical protein
MSNIRHNVSYGNAEVRGQLRMWKRKLAQHYRIFDEFFRQLQNGIYQPIAANMVRGSRSTRKTAFDRIHKGFGPGVTLEEVNLKGRGDHAYAIWSILKPRAAVAVRSTLEDYSESERESLLQDCVTVNYVVVGTSMVLVCDGLWTLEVPDHALGRAVERSKFLHPGALIREAHLNVLDLPMSLVERDKMFNQDITAYLKAGLGCFVSQFRISKDMSVDEDFATFVRVKTWLDEDQLYEDQIILTEKGEKGQQLRDSFLKPHPFIRLVETEPGVIQLMVWHGRKQ